jgi:hypothetical protein
MVTLLMLVLSVTPVTELRHRFQSATQVIPLEIENSASSPSQFLAVGIILDDATGLNAIKMNRLVRTPRLMIDKEECFNLFIGNKRMVCIVPRPAGNQVHLWEALPITDERPERLEQELQSIKKNPEGRALVIALPSSSEPKRKFRTISEVPNDIAGGPVLERILSAIPISIGKTRFSLVAFKTANPSLLAQRKEELVLNGKSCRWLGEMNGSPHCLAQFTDGAQSLWIGPDEASAAKDIEGLFSGIQASPHSCERLRFENEAELGKFGALKSVARVNNFRNDAEEDFDVLGVSQTHHRAFTSILFTGNPLLLSSRIDDLYVGKYRCKFAHSADAYGNFLCVVPRLIGSELMWLAPARFIETQPKDADIKRAQQKAKDQGLTLVVKGVFTKPEKISDIDSFARTVYAQ